MIASLLILGLVCTALAWLVFFALIAEVGASRGTVFTYINLAVSVLLGVTFLAEPLNAAIIGGFILILVGSWLSTTGRGPVPATRPVRRIPWLLPRASRALGASDAALADARPRDGR